MPLNLTNRTASPLTVNGTDLTAFFVSREVRSEMLDVRGGLILQSGTMDLRGNEANRATLDPELNPSLWQQGNEVIYRVKNSAGTSVIHPAGRLYIRTASFHRNVTTVELECRLTMALSQNATTDVSGVPVGGQTFLTRTQIAQNLLSAVGLAGLLTGTADEWPINYGLPVNDGAIIEQLGHLLACAGYFAYQNNAGLIEVRKTDLNPGTPITTITIGQDEAEYEPLRGVEAIPSEVWAQGTQSWFDAASLNTTLTETGIDGTKTTTVTWSGNTRTKTVSDQRIVDPLYKLFDPTIAVETTETTIFEPDTGSTTLDPSNQGRILSRTETTESPAFLVLGLPPTIGLETATESAAYIYFDTPAYQTGLKLAIAATKTTSYGQVAFFAGPPTETLQQSWELVNQPDYWRSTETMQLQGSIFYGSASQSLLASQGRVNIREGNDGSTQPPKTDVRPNPNPQSTQPINSKVKVIPPSGSYPTKRERAYQFDYLAGATSPSDPVPSQQLAYLAALAVGLIQARWSGRSLKLGLSDAILGYAPLSRLDAVDGSVTRRHLLDAPTWTDTPTESSVRFQCMTVGIVNNGTALAPPVVVSQEIICGDWDGAILEVEPFIEIVCGDWDGADVV